MRVQMDAELAAPSAFPYPLTVLGPKTSMIENRKRFDGSSTPVSGIRPTAGRGRAGPWARS